MSKDKGLVKSWPATKIEMWPVDDLVPYARNARLHSPEQIERIAESISRFGFTMPILVAEDGTIIAGHGRTMAAKALDLAEVPVMVARGWTDDMRRAYTLADNRLTETSEWDFAMLKSELDDLRLDLGDDILSGIGFSEKEIKSILPDNLFDPKEIEAPDDFKEFGEDVETEHQCPKCGYRWSGKAA